MSNLSVTGCGPCRAPANIHSSSPATPILNATSKHYAKNCTRDCQTPSNMKDATTACGPATMTATACTACRMPPPPIPAAGSCAPPTAFSPPAAVLNASTATVTPACGCTHAHPLTATG